MAATERLAAAVRIHRVLDVGCGRGVAASLICQLLGQGTLLGLDRSAVAVSAAYTRNADPVAAGRAAFRQLALADVEPDAPGVFEKILAVDVNLFWTGPATCELRILARLLAPEGRLVLCFAPPDPGRLDHLTQAGFGAFATTRPFPRGSALLAVVAQPPGSRQPAP
ncbi:class I SAM-dependent methyltransferase [Streptomyces sp. 21So2-11]|uniref:class I SAM-dependent methyltransferase n=1 Tax=Streptomyces sp. 21So2-11 TaxID=3144408 RepID=UPI00321B9605